MRLSSPWHQQPRIEINRNLLAQYGLEPLDEFSGFGTRRGASRDGYDGYGLGFAQLAARYGYQSRDRSG
jgi:hypothetical protein